MSNRNRPLARGALIALGLHIVVRVVTLVFIVSALGALVLTAALAIAYAVSGQG